MTKNLSYVLLVIGVLCILFSFYLFYLRFSSYPLRFEGRPTTVNAISYDSPQKIEIPAIGVALPIVTSVIDDKTYPTTTIGVSYLASTPVPGNKGNSVLYGHNWASLLAHLPQVKPGEYIYITLKSGEKKTFKVEYTAVVSPDQTYIIDSTTDTRITLYTCTGFLDSKRFVVVAKPGQT